MSRLTSPLSAPDFQKDGQEFFKQFDKIQHERDDNLLVHTYPSRSNYLTSDRPVYGG